MSTTLRLCSHQAFASQSQSQTPSSAAGSLMHGQALLLSPEGESETLKNYSKSNNLAKLKIRGPLNILMTNERGAVLGRCARLARTNLPVIRLSLNRSQ